MVAVVVVVVVVVVVHCWAMLGTPAPSLNQHPPITATMAVCSGGCGGSSSSCKAGEAPPPTTPSFLNRFRRVLTPFDPF